MSEQNCQKIAFASDLYCGGRESFPPQGRFFGTHLQTQGHVEGVHLPFATMRRYVMVTLGVLVPRYFATSLPRCGFLRINFKESL